MQRERARARVRARVRGQVREGRGGCGADSRKGGTQAGVLTGRNVMLSSAV